MKKVACIGLLSVVFLLFSGIGLADDKYSISGKVGFTGKETIYIALYTREAFKEYKRPLPSKPYLQIIKPTADQVKGGKASFEFSAIPKGTYCILAFQDLDNDGKMKTEGGGGAIVEPWDSFRESTRSTASWNDLKFELKSDLDCIVLNIGG